MTMTRKTDSRPRQLISERFRYTGQRAFPSGSLGRQRAIDAFLTQVRTGAYKFTNSDCPCGRPSDDVVIAEVDRYGLPLTQVLCFGCGTVRIDPYLDPTSLDHFYRELYQDLYARAVDSNEYFSRQRTYGQKVLRWSAAVPPGSVLEVGCGAGGGLSVFQDAGWFVAGCDYSERLIEFGRQKQVPNLFADSAEQISRHLGDKRFDLIYLHHVFEHVDNPMETFKTLRELLAVGGQLLIIVPKLAGIHKYPYPAGDALGCLHIAHKYNYTAVGLARIAARVGLTATEITPPPSIGFRAPELWMSVTVPTDPPVSTTNRIGKSLLQYLRRTELLFRMGCCPAQLKARVQRSKPWRLGARVVRRFRQRDIDAGNC